MEPKTFVKQLRGHMTDAERLLWRRLRAHRLNGEKFRRQQAIGPYVADFVHFGARLIVEADGGQHNGAADDRRRDAWLRRQGFKVLRFWNHEILNETEAVLESILKAVADAPSLPAPSLRRKGSPGVGVG
jgi:very-short-patch-repair endonuclease